ncbi:nuclear transport factor 2 family protein [Dactylosporangium vinaceum]|uniref:Nuclear transport factor 2 family protein n=1 Tax=Dactylosporangium vinaceum TaxID=53362 RepID=A0ABV5MP97_9ACTN|nr:nuclear transport factor 2 family protein [Dactylosporangium vinaceum]UAB94544.1 nuclear transport factor 2 family protein [Dactylosporangium vinaceum]
MNVDVYALHRAFVQAELRADTGALRELLAEDFRSIGDQGYVLDKAQWIAKFADFAYTALDSSDVEVSAYDRAAVVRYVQRSRSVWQGQAMALTSRASQIWVAQPGGWRLAGLQFSSLPDQPA